MRISRAQPIYSGKKGGMTRPARKPYTYLPPHPQYQYLVHFFPAWKQGNFIWRETTPLYARQSLAYRLFVCSHRSHFCRKAEPCDKNHKNSRFFLQKPQKFAQFWQKIQKFAFILCVFTFQNHFRHLLGVFLGFKSGFAPHPKRFHLSKELLLLRLACFGFQKNFCDFPEAFSAFKSSFVVSPRRFRASKVFLRSTRGVFGVQKFFCCSARRVFTFQKRFQFDSDKNHHTLRRI